MKAWREIKHKRDGRSHKTRLRRKIKGSSLKGKKGKNLRERRRLISKEINLQKKRMRLLARRLRR